MIKPHKTSSARRRVPSFPFARPASENTAAANASSVSAERPEPANGRRGPLYYADPPDVRRAEYLDAHAWIRGEEDES